MVREPGHKGRLSQSFDALTQKSFFKSRDTKENRIYFLNRKILCNKDFCNNSSHNNVVLRTLDSSFDTVL